MGEKLRVQLENLKKWLVKHWDGPEAQELNRLKTRLKRKFTNMAEPMNQVDYTQENYDKLFPDNKVSTPIGEVRLRRDQYIKLGNRNRKDLLGAMQQTLTNPIAVINEDRNGKTFKLFGKSFIDGLPDKKILMSVINHKDKGVTTHDRDINNFLNKIKNPADLLYEKQVNGANDPAGNDTYVRDLAISGDTQSPINIPQPTHNVNKKNDKNQKRE
jgi:hypothetical protein